MSLRLTRNDLWVKGHRDHHCGLAGCVVVNDHNPSAADLVEVIQSEGGEVEEAYVLEGWTRIDVKGLGRYLVWRIEGEE